MSHVLLLNGSPHVQGCTFVALSEVAAELEKAGVSTEIIQIGQKPYRGCIACGYCHAHDGCAVDGGVNEIAAKLAKSDGLVVGSPVYYASANGTVTALLDRLFYSFRGDLRMKVGAAVVSCRRGGASATFDQLNKYFTISGMPVASSQYWNSIHGNTPEEARQDLEGMQIMRALGRNMAFLIRSIALGRETFGLPDVESRVHTNFIR